MHHLRPLRHAASVSDSIEDVSVISPDYMGSQDGKLVPALAARYRFEGTERYVVLLGTQVPVNVLDDKNWRFGPQLTYRAGRDNEVDDPVVGEMPSTDRDQSCRSPIAYRLAAAHARTHAGFDVDVEHALQPLKF